MADKRATPHSTHDMQKEHSHDTPSVQEVPIVGDSSNSEWDPKADTLHQGSHDKSAQKPKIYK